MEFTYIPLSDLMTGPAEFNWRRLDTFLSEVAGRGHQAVFRIWLEFPTAPTGVPRFLIDQGVKMTAWDDRNERPVARSTRPTTLTNGSLRLSRRLSPRSAAATTMIPHRLHHGRPARQVGRMAPRAPPGTLRQHRHARARDAGLRTGFPRDAHPRAVPDG